MAVDHVTPERLRQLLHYDPQTGRFTWATSGNGRPPVGTRAGASHGNKYRSINVDGRYYSEHRLVFLYMVGRLPGKRMRVDHINHVRDDNRWSNLREVTNSENMQNQTRPMSSNKVGLLGVSPGRGGKFIASIFLNGKARRIGQYDCKHEAHAAYVAEKRKLHPACTL